MSAEYECSSIQIIESLGTSDEGAGDELVARLLGKGGKLADFPMDVHDVFDRAELFATLEKIFASEAKAGSVPILHFEAHGEENGLILRDKSVIPWGVLAKILRSFNRATRFNLLVCFSCCEGIHQLSVLNTKNMCPFSAVVGCEGSIYTRELLDGFEKFYTILINEGKASKAIRALQGCVVDSTGTKFTFLPAERAFRQVQQQIRVINSDPKLRKERIAYYRNELQRLRTIDRNLQPTTKTEIEKLLMSVERGEMRAFHENFFGLREIPENAARFPL
jgi:hypothetical protein